jgi:hypothetical protein
MKGKFDRAAKRIIGTLFIPAKVTTERLSILAWCWIVLLLGGKAMPVNRSAPEPLFGADKPEYETADGGAR